MLKNFKLFALVISLVLSSAVFAPVFAQAESGLGDEDIIKAIEEPSKSPNKNLDSAEVRQKINKAKERNNEIREKMAERKSEVKEKNEEKLSDARKKMCEARADKIENRLKSMHSLAVTKHKGKEKRFERVDKFYNEKLVPNGHTLANYDELKAAIEASKANVVALHEAAKATGLEFSCDSEDPRGQVDAFREDMRELIEANKEYKESLKTFIMAVRDLAKTAKMEKVSGTPSVTAVPTEGDSE
jgi:hypothetical protein